MICRSCGNELTDGSIFCPKCGTRIMIPETPAAEKTEDFIRRDDPPAAPVIPVPEPAAAPDMQPAAAPRSPEIPFGGVRRESLASEQADRALHESIRRPEIPSEPVRSSGPERTSGIKKKEFFGVGAFVFCLFVIAMLAISTGVFAYLYTSAIGLI